MYNGKEIKKALKKAAEPVKKSDPYGKDVSQYGYRDDSPFRDSPSLNIFTQNGLIDMSHTGIPLVANGRFLPPYSGLHQFDTNVVEERPVMQPGGMTGMMKARMAYANEFGNPAAKRMVNPNPITYDFGNGDYGTHMMGSYGNEARPKLQEINGKLQYIENPKWGSPENIQFDRPEDAEYFAEHYKEVAPMMRNKMGTGGWLDQYQGEPDDYKKGGPVNPLQLKRSKRNRTHMNIQSSINELFLRNYTLYGPAGHNIYDPKSKYQEGGLRSASTTGYTPVSTQAPVNPTNPTGWDWVKHKWNTRDQGPSDWNFMMMDKTGSYVDSGVDPFMLMLAAPQQVLKAGTTIPKVAKKLGNPKGTVEDIAHMKEVEKYGLKVEPDFSRYQRKLDTDLMNYNKEYGTDLFVKNPNPTNADKLTGYSDIPGFNQELQQLKAQSEFGKQPLLNKADFVNQTEGFINKLQVKHFNKKTGKVDIKAFMKEAQEEGISPDEILSHTLKNLAYKSERPLGSKPFYFNSENPRAGTRAVIYSNPAGSNTEFGNYYKAFAKDLNETGPMGGKYAGNIEPLVQQGITKLQGFLKDANPEQSKKIQETIEKLTQAGYKDLKSRITGLPYTGSEAFKTLSPNKYGGQKGWLDQYK